MKTALLFSFLLISTAVLSQKVNGKLQFGLGQVFEISVVIKTSIIQQAMGQAIDFNVDATGHHSYKVTNTTDDNSTLNHQVNQIVFTFDGMGQKINFNSRNEKDMNGRLGKPVKEILEKKYDMIIDSNGKTLMVVPEKIQLSPTDNSMAIISSMLRDVFDLVQPPQKGSSSFFKVLPGGETEKAKPWTESFTNETGKFDAAYSIADINDSTIVIDFAASSVTVSKAEMMGSVTTTTMNNKSTGKIFLDRNTCIIKEKTFSTESNGNTEASFGTLPVTSKTTTTILVKQVNSQ